MRRRLVLCAVVLGVCILEWTPSAHAQAGDSWYAEQTSTALVQRIQIQGTMGRNATYEKAEPDSAILEVVGTFGKRGTERPSLAVSEITVTLVTEAKPPAAGRRVQLLAIGVKGTDDTCYYEFPTLGGRLSGEVTDAAGNGYRLEKGKGSDSAVVTWPKNPSTLCFAFKVPSGSVRAAALNLGQRKVDLALPTQPK